MDFVHTFQNFSQYFESNNENLMQIWNYKMHFRVVFLNKSYEETLSELPSLQSTTVFYAVELDPLQIPQNQRFS